MNFKKNFWKNVTFNDVKSDSKTAFALPSGGVFFEIYS